MDQRFLGDQRFLAALQRKTDTKHEVTLKGFKVLIARLLHAVTEATAHSTDRLVRAGRQRDRVEARALLVYATREWSGLTVKELGRRLHRDPSMISRLYATYVAQRTGLLQKWVQAILMT